MNLTFFIFIFYFLFDSTLRGGAGTEGLQMHSEGFVVKRAPDKHTLSQLASFLFKLTFTDITN